MWRGWLNPKVLLIFFEKTNLDWFASLDGVTYLVSRKRLNINKIWLHQSIEDGWFPPSINFKAKIYVDKWFFFLDRKYCLEILTLFKSRISWKRFKIDQRFKILGSKHGILYDIIQGFLTFRVLRLWRLDKFEIWRNCSFTVPHFQARIYRFITIYWPL